MATFVRGFWICTAVMLAPALALAQAPGATTGTPATPPAATAGPPPAATTTTAPATSASTTSPATGYGWGSTKPTGAAGPPATTRRWTGPPRAATPDATLPGFETLGDGSSRLFVQLTKNVAVVEQKATGTLTYVLKGAHVHLRNNTNALVTVHFNTPVTRARLVPHGNDTLFVVELRANVAPTWKMTPAKDGTAILQVDFPRGDYLPGAAPAATSAAPTGTTPATTAPAPTAKPQ